MSDTTGGSTAAATGERAPLLIRADATPEMGTGHWMRCLALAQAWRDAGGRVALASARSVSALEGRFGREDVELITLSVEAGSADDARETALAAKEVGAGWVMLDGYFFEPEYRQALVDGGVRLLCVDDNGRNADSSSDIVLNQNVWARMDGYDGLGLGTQRLIGPSFALLRREFGVWTGQQPTVADVASTILVTLGGADEAGVTELVLEALAGDWASGFEADVLLGAARRRDGDSDEWQSPESDVAVLQDSAAGARIRVVRNSPDIAALMARADIAIAAGGTTCLELAFMGLPALLVAVADNQTANVAEWAALGAARDLGAVADLRAGSIARPLADLAANREERARMSAIGQAAVDGGGARRVIAAMDAHEHVRARVATGDDATRLFEWVNDPVTRSMSLRTDQIAWNDHVRWLESQLSDPEARLYILTWREGGEDEPVGQMRVDTDGTISFALAPAWRGRGLAAPALRIGLSAHAASTPMRRFRALIRPENTRSLSTFEQAGFRQADPVDVHGVRCTCWYLEEARS